MTNEKKGTDSKPVRTLRLRAGELGPQEIRAVLAVLGWKQREILAQAKAAPGADGWLDRSAPRMKGAAG